MHHSDDDRERAIIASVSLLSKKWMPEVVLALHENGDTGFNDLRRTLPGLSAKVLSDRLDTLAEHGVVDRVVVSESPLRVEYNLTAAGTELAGTVFGAVADWGVTHLNSEAPQLVVADHDRRFTALFRRWFSTPYVVHRAHDPLELLESVDETTVAVIVDRHLLESADDDVVDLVRSVNDSCRMVAMTTDRIGVDLVDLECDALVRKPASKADFEAVLDAQFDRLGEPSQQREFHALEERRRLLEEHCSRAMLDDSDRYAALCDRIDSLSADGVPSGTDD